MNIGDDVVVLASDRLARICDVNNRGYYVQLSGSDAKAFVGFKDVRRAERNDIIRLQSRERQRFLTRKELDPIQALLAARQPKKPAVQTPSTDPIERFLRDEA